VGAGVAVVSLGSTGWAHNRGSVVWFILVAFLAVAAVLGDVWRRKRGGEDSESLSWRSRHSRGYRDR
jgi:hypothetical protein